MQWFFVAIGITKKDWKGFLLYNKYDIIFGPKIDFKSVLWGLKNKSTTCLFEAWWAISGIMEEQCFFYVLSLGIIKIIWHTFEISLGWGCEGGMVDSISKVGCIPHPTFHTFIQTKGSTKIFTHCFKAIRFMQHVGWCWCILLMKLMKKDNVYSWQMIILGLSALKEKWEDNIFLGCASCI